jgi:hemolysin-activating ACP:hemolysin acyltransferase
LGSESELWGRFGVDGVDSVGDKFASNFLKSLDPAQVGVALSKLVAASIGDLVVLLSRSPGYKHFSLSDIEWMVLPPVSLGQVYIVEAMDKERGFRAPIAAVTWAFVSQEVEETLQQQATPIRRLRPDQWNCGSIGWLIDAVGGAQGVRHALQWLGAEGPFRERPLKLVAHGAGEAPKVTTLAALIADQGKAGGSSP